MAKATFFRIPWPILPFINLLPPYPLTERRGLQWHKTGLPPADYLYNREKGRQEHLAKILDEIISLNGPVDEGLEHHLHERGEAVEDPVG